MPNTFPKIQRLTGEIRIGKLHMQGKSFLSYPFRIVYMPDKKIEDAPVRVVINVPKRRMKHAVDRNLLKRRTREAYRLNNKELAAVIAAKDFSLHISINYIANEKILFPRMEKKMKEALNKLTKIYSAE